MQPARSPSILLPCPMISQRGSGRREGPQAAPSSDEGIKANIGHIGRFAAAGSSSSLPQLRGDGASGGRGGDVGRHLPLPGCLAPATACIWSGYLPVHHSRVVGRGTVKGQMLSVDKLVEWEKNIGRNG